MKGGGWVQDSQESFRRFLLNQQGTKLYQMQNYSTTNKCLGTVEFFKKVVVRTIHPCGCSCWGTGLEGGGYNLWLASKATTFSCLWAT